ncbi:hypothetical protein U1Q18_031262, partial [Sarracenia purpurea var. burkii]
MKAVALQGREGVQLLIYLLEQQQECAVALLCLLSHENDENKWAITAASGILHSFKFWRS